MKSLWTPELVTEASAPTVRHGHVVQQRVEQAKVTQCDFQLAEGLQLRGLKWQAL